jgi:hypothetical protein
MALQIVGPDMAVRFVRCYALEANRTTVRTCSHMVLMAHRDSLLSSMPYLMSCPGDIRPWRDASSWVFLEDMIPLLNGDGG